MPEDDGSHSTTILMTSRRDLTRCDKIDGCASSIENDHHLQIEHSVISIRHAGAAFKSGEFFFELIDSFSKGSKCQLAYVIGVALLLLFLVQQLKFLQFCASVFPLPPVFYTHIATSIIPLATRLRSVANVFPVNCANASSLTNSMLINGSPLNTSTSASAVDFRTTPVSGPTCCTHNRSTQSMWESCLRL